MSRCILVVEDDFYIRESIRELLEEEGHTVVCADHGAHALTLLETLRPPPDLILLDLMMPVKDGFQFRTEQRADARFAHIPVVVMSADPQLDSRREVLAARSYLRKPVDIDLLLAAAAAPAA
ncbi:response regulator [Corallococcus praedator]|uniref:Response regulator n=1 Tax=Corallococcus praedator TaxID=2316724 RepID=A0ABX9QN20_9BACT|nr:MULTISPECIES: response regulator [Corallococcus]RKH21054.1 response regulator [Corallococcus sp. CA047B]RKH33108.1 response regulator [Corallococcus sp. CA031C]RKI12752.1 response regulator [Corallococcus praedator]